MEKVSRKKYSAEFKAKVAIAAFKRIEKIADWLLNMIYVLPRIQT